MKQELLKIIEELRDVIKQQQMNISDDVLFRESCTFLRGILAQRAKETSNPIRYTEKDRKIPEKATEPQIDLLYRLNADFNAETITKKQAFELIKKLKEEKDGKKKS